MDGNDHLTIASEDEVQKEMENLNEANKKEQHRIRVLEAKVIQNVNLYFVFQAVVLVSTVTASSSPTKSCRNWWIPFLLSLIAAVQNLLSLQSSTWEILKSREELYQNMADLAFMKLYQMTRAQLAGGPPAAHLVNRGGGEVVRPKPGLVRTWKPRLLVCLSFGLFVGFSAVIMYGFHTILCH